MSAAPIKVSLKSFDLFERPVTLRLPFRFGAVTVREAMQGFVRAEVGVQGGARASGAAAELMVPKWFDKSPELSNEVNVNQLRTALRLAREAYLSEPGARTVFGFHARHAAAVKQAAAARGLPPLVASFGLALVDRAMIDAVCRARGRTFAEAVTSNVLGFEPRHIAPDLQGLDTARFLGSLSPAPAIAARHTVGLLDPIDTSDPRPEVHDGLPVTLEEVIAAYGNRCFKLKLCGRVGEDIDRLARIAAVLDRRVGDYQATLDGNEQYPDAGSVAELVQRMAETRALDRLRAATLFVEQPIARATALDAPLGALGQRVPVIIDESDGDDGALPRALALGYRGVSSKACKGVWRSLVNAARLRSAGPGAILSGEDLTTQAGLAVQQDLALVSLLGLGHVERNGHHYADGFGVAPVAEAAGFRAAHPDLYAETSGKVRLAIENGTIALASVNAAKGLGSSVHPDFAAMVAASLTNTLMFHVKH